MMKFEGFYRKVNVGDRVKVTDNFLTHIPTWKGSVIAKNEGELTIQWEDNHKDTVFSSALVHDTDDFDLA